MEEANNHICAAHNAQTEMIQSEIAGTETIQPSLLFNHAQDDADDRYVRDPPVRENDPGI